MTGSSADGSSCDGRDTQRSSLAAQPDFDTSGCWIWALRNEHGPISHVYCG